MRKCKTCGEEKNDYAFGTSVNSKTGREYLRRHCRSCVSKKQQQSRRQNNLLNNYGITEVEYELMLKLQNGVCKICGQPETTRGRNSKIKKLAVDHCHMTCKIRGLLCDNCNQMLGKVKDNPEILRKAAEYLEKHK